MNKKKWIRIVSIYSVIYTVITLLNSALYLCNGIYEDPSGNWHELDRAMILLIGIAAFELCTNLPVKPLVLRYLLAYIPSQLLAFAYVWFSGLREPLAKTAYRDIWINFTGLFVLLCIINTVVYVFKKKRGQEGKGKKWKQEKLFLWHSSHCGRNHHVRNRVFSGSVKQDKNSESSEFL